MEAKNRRSERKNVAGQARNQDFLCMCVWGGGGGANEAKVDQTTEIYFVSV